MSKYVLVGKHHRPTYRRGDLEAEDVLVIESTFSTRKAANACLKKIQREHELQGRKTKARIVARGEKDSLLMAYTGYVWTHENSGERHEEYYNYIVYKPL